MPVPQNHCLPDGYAARSADIDQMLAGA
jgi:hypothetical protein